MKMNLNASIPIGFFLSKKKQNDSSKNQLIDYYEKAGPDYKAWSPNFNMHFGYYRKWMNPFNREAMLQEMNKVVLGKLKIKKNHVANLVDMGCGMGTTLRQASCEFPNIRCTGVTLVPWQKKQAETLNDQLNQNDNIQILLENYTSTSLPSSSVDHVIAIESSCYATGADKQDLLTEIHRVLKPGGTFVIADGFLKTKKRMPNILKSTYSRLCKSWALSELGNIEEVKKTANELRFSNVFAQDISWRVAPSVAHVPSTVIRFLLKQLFSKERMNKYRWDNLISPLLTMVLGLHRSFFGYYLVSGEKL